MGYEIAAILAYISIIVCFSIVYITAKEKTTKIAVLVMGLFFMVLMSSSMLHIAGSDTDAVKNNLGTAYSVLLWVFRLSLAIMLIYMFIMGAEYIMRKKTGLVDGEEEEEQ